MKLTSAIAIYFITWWLSLFFTLPFGIRNPHEAGVAVAEGHDPGAPVAPRLWRKLGITTVIATILFIFIYLIITRGWLSFDDFAWLADIPKGQ